MSIRGFGRLLVADVRSRRLLGTVLFVVVVAIASAAMVAGLESRRDAGRVWDAAFDRALAPHVILSAATAGALEAPSRDPRVAARSTPVAQTGGELIVDGGRVALDVRAASTTALPAVGAPYVVRGRLATQPGDIALERSLAKDLGISIGDRITIASGANSEKYTVVGTVLDFQDCFYPQCDTGVAWVDPSGLDRLSSQRWYTSLLRLREPETAPAFTADALQRYGDRLTFAQDWLDTRRDALSVNLFFGAFLSGFGLFVLIAAGIVVAGSVTNRVVARRRDIGLEKAIGVTPRQVVGLITVEHLLLGGLGLIAGWLLAIFLMPSLRLGVTEVLEPSGRSLAPASFLGAAVALVVIIAVATIAPSARIGRLTTTAALQPPTGRGGGSTLARLAVDAGSGPVVVGGLKDAFARPLRSFLAATSIVLAIVAVLMTLGLSRTVKVVTSRPALTGDPWDVSIEPTRPVDQTRMMAAITTTPGVARAFFEAQSRRVIDGQVHLVRAVGGPPSAARYVVREGRRMTAGGEAMAGYGLLQRLGKHVGDSVTVEIEDRKVPLTIVGRYAETEDSGEVLLTRWESFADIFTDAHPDVYRAVATGGTSRTRLAADLQHRLGNDAVAKPLVVDTGDLDAFGLAFWLVAGLVLAVALANLGSTVLLGVRERLRDLGVMRAVGFTPAQLVASTAISTAALVLVALLIGVPLGLWLNNVLLRGVGEAIGYGPEIGSAPAAVTAILTIGAVAATAIGIGALTCVRSARASATELLRYE